MQVQAREQVKLRTFPLSRKGWAGPELSLGVGHMTHPTGAVIARVEVEKLSTASPSAVPKNNSSYHLTELSRSPQSVLCNTVATSHVWHEACGTEEWNF